MTSDKFNEPILVSGDAQVYVSSPCGLLCGDREQIGYCTRPDRGASYLTESEDCTVKVLTGVLDTNGNNSDATTLFCQYCKKTFKRKSCLSRHLATCQDRKLNCPHCQPVFRDLEALNEHGCHPRKTPPAGMGNKEVVCQKCSRRFKRACGLGRHVKSGTGTTDSSVEPNPINDKRLLQCTDCTRLFKRLSGLASHRRAFHADATCKTPEHRTESSSEQCSTTTCKTQQSANATSQQNLHSAGDCVEELKHGPNVSPDDAADIPLLNRWSSPLPNVSFSRQIRNKLWMRC